jgi:hypothetical protein
MFCASSASTAVVIASTVVAYNLCCTVTAVVAVIGAVAVT